MKPSEGSSLCCGFLSLLTAVELICLVDLITKVATLGVVSSAEDLDFAGVRIPPAFQLCFGAWQLVGIGLLVGAGVGALYRIETHLRLYQLYWQASAVLYFVSGAIIALSGNICSSVISAEAMRHGTALVCGFVDTFVLTWGAIGLGLCVYFGIVVGAAADEIAAEIPTGLLERFRKAEEQKQVFGGFPDYGANGPRAMPVPWMPGVIPQAPLSAPPMAGPGYSVMQAMQPSMPMNLNPSSLPAMPPTAPLAPGMQSPTVAQSNPFALK